MASKIKSPKDTEESKFVDVDGQQVLVLTPDYQRPLALVDLAVIKRLSSYLPKANLYDIRSTFINELNNANDISEYVNVIAEELAFHKSVNLINEVDINNLGDKPSSSTRFVDEYD